MTEPIRISVPPLGSTSPMQADGGAFSPALVARMLCSVQTDLQGILAESVSARALLERIADAVEASSTKMEVAARKMAEATETLNLRGWAIEHRLEAMRPAVEAARAAVEADTQARSGGQGVPSR